MIWRISRAILTFRMISLSPRRRLLSHARLPPPRLVPLLQLLLLPLIQVPPRQPLKLTKLVSCAHRLVLFNHAFQTLPVTRFDGSDVIITVYRVVAHYSDTITTLTFLRVDADSSLPSHSIPPTILTASSLIPFYRTLPLPTDSSDTATTPASTDDEQVTNDTDDPIDSDSGADSDADDDSGDGSQETSGDGSSEDDDSGNGSQVDADSDSSADADSDGDDGDQSTPSSGDPSNEEGTSSNVEGIGSCFPSTSKVELQSGATIPISQLRIGDSVRVSVDTFSEVFLFSHRTSSSAPSYIEITTTATNHTLTLTPGHYLYINHQLRPAHTVEVGHQILTAHQGWATVSAVRRTDASGLYNPHTVQGDIVVDGFVASTYTTAVPTHIATSLLAPLRALYRRGFVSERLFGSFLAEGFRDGILRTVQ